MAKKHGTFEVKIPMLSLAMSSHHKAKPQDTKSFDEGSKLDKRRAKSVEKQQPQKEYRGQAPLSAGVEKHWKPPSHADLMKEGTLREIRNSTHDWVAGRKSTAEHKKTMARSKQAMGFKT